MRVCAFESLQTPCHQPPQKLQIYCGALQRHLILLTVYLMCVFHLLVFVFVLSLFVCFSAFGCHDDGLFDDKIVLFCEPACGCALAVDDDED